MRSIFLSLKYFVKDSLSRQCLCVSEETSDSYWAACRLIHLMSTLGGNESIVGDVRLPLVLMESGTSQTLINSAVVIDESVVLMSWASNLFVSSRHYSKRVYRLQRRREKSAGGILGLPVWNHVHQTRKYQHFQYSRQRGENHGRPFLCANW